MPSSTMPSSATTTVEPANRTERPAVSMAVTVAARVSAPAARSLRKRLMISSA
jgi:hypothetical protein